MQATTKDRTMPLRYADLREFLQYLEGRDQLRRIDVSVSPILEMTEISDRVLRQGGPALLFRNPEAEGRRWHFPVLTNLFGTPERVALGMGEDSVAALREVGRLLAYLKEPEPPRGLKDAWEKFPVLRQVMNMAPKVSASGPCREVEIPADSVDLDALPIQHLGRRAVAHRPRVRRPAQS